MIDDPLSLLTAIIWLAALAPWPVAFLFGACSPCCQQPDPCPWLLEFDRCLRVEIVGSDPLDGGDCRIISSRAGTGDVEYMTSSLLEVHRVQSRIRITVRTSISASGASRTPVGETRTQVWRFNRAAPSSPASTVYDVLGPDWHLQVDLSVTGVATQAEAGVVSSIEQDSEGQPKLVLQVNQWTATITHDEVVTLFPVGLQRWGPGIGGTQSFRLTTSTASATRVSGDNISGWSVSKLSGLTIEERKFAARLNGTLCTAGAGGAMTQRIILDDEVAVDFLNGEEDLRVSVSTAERDLRILPNNALCEASRDLVGMGVALGIYPEEIYADVPEAVIAANEAWCAEEATFALKPNNNICPTSWASVQYQRPGLTFPASFFSPISSVVSNFWPGRSLLWNLEQGPYRTSFTGTGPSTPNTGWTYRIDGDGGNLNPLFLSPLSATPCRSGLTSTDAPDLTCVSTVTVSWPDTPVTVVARRNSDDAIATAETTYPAGSLTLSAGVAPNTVGGPNQTSVGYPNEPRLFYSGAIVTGPNHFTPTLTWDFGTIQPTYVLRLSVQFYAFSVYDSCAVPYQPSLRVRGFLTGITFYDLQPVDGQAGSSSYTFRTQTQSDNLFIRSSINVPTEEHEADINPDEVTIDVAHRLRRVCGPWSPNPVPAEGATITRSCDITDSEVTEDTVTETFNVPASRSRFPKTLGYYPNGYGEEDQITQLGRCRLLGLRNLNSTATTPVATTVLVAATANQCFAYLPLFGETDTAATLCSGDLSNLTSVPCEDCTPAVAITSGEENASVEYITSGDKAGTIRVIAKRTWLSGEGVTFTVTCGGDAITQTIQRS
jgi:hypothetical protein